MRIAIDFPKYRLKHSLGLHLIDPDNVFERAWEVSEYLTILDLAVGLSFLSFKENSTIEAYDRIGRNLESFRLVLSEYPTHESRWKHVLEEHDERYRGLEKPAER